MQTDNPFEKVLDRLRKVGWRKWEFGIADGPNCIRGAAIHLDINQWEIASGIISIIETEYPDRVKSYGETVIKFNDHPHTVFKDVERVLEKAAIKWEEDQINA